MIEFTSLQEALETVRKGDRSITFIEGKLDNRVVGYEELYQNSLGLLYDLQEQGLKQGDQLILFSKDNQSFVEAFWACVFGGIIPVPVAVGISDEHKAKLLRIFNKLERPYLFTEQDHLDRLVKYAEEHDMHESISVVRNKTILANLIERHGNKGKIHSVKPEDMAFIQFSSGSTSEPKGVVLSHENIMTNLNALAIGTDYRPDDISLSWMPLTHDLGLLGFHLNMVLVNISQCLMPTDLFSRRPVLWLQKVSELKASVLCSPNFGYKHFLKAMGDKKLDDVDLSRVRVIFNGAEPISLDLCEEFLERMVPYGLKHETMWTVYGLAEATLAVALPPVGENYQSVYVDRHKIKIADRVEFIDKDDDNALGFAIEGKAVNDIGIKITDEDNVSLNENKVGLVQIKGPSVTKGYYQDPDASADALTGDGWLQTGDLGFLTEDQELIITGRHKDIIFANAQNYYPHDIESVALQLSELELNKIVAYGVRVPNADTDELLIFILFRADLKDFIGIVRDVTRHINEQTGLEVSRVIPVTRIPKTTSGKLQRGILGEAYLNGEYDKVNQEIDKLLIETQVQSTGGLTKTEQQIKNVCDKVVIDKSIGLQDNFFETGISSLTLTEIHQGVDEVYPGLVDVTDMFEYQSITDLANFIDEKMAS